MRLLTVLHMTAADFAIVDVVVLFASFPFSMFGVHMIFGTANDRERDHTRKEPTQPKQIQRLSVPVICRRRQHGEFCSNLGFSSYYNSDGC